jgi:hypothetical protein
MSDRKAVALALVATFLVIVADEILNRNRAPNPRRIVGFAVVFLVLGFMVEIQGTAKVAKYFSVLLFLGVLYKVGPGLFVHGRQAIAPRTQRKAPTTSGARKVAQ